MIQRDRQGFCRRPLCIGCAQPAVRVHECDHMVASCFELAWPSDRIERRRCANQARQRRSLRDCQGLRGNVEVGARCRAKPVRTAAQVHLIEIPLKNRILAIPVLKLRGRDCIPNLAHDRTTSSGKVQLRQLFGDRACADDHPSPSEIRKTSTLQSRDVYPAVVIEARVLCREHRITDNRRKLLDAHRPTADERSWDDRPPILGNQTRPRRQRSEPRRNIKGQTQRVRQGTTQPNIDWIQLHRHDADDQRESCAAPYPLSTSTSSQTSCPSPPRNTRACASTLKKRTPSAQRTHASRPSRPTLASGTYLRRAGVSSPSLQRSRAHSHCATSSPVRTEWTMWLMSTRVGAVEPTRERFTGSGDRYLPVHARTAKCRRAFPCARQHRSRRPGKPGPVFSECSSTGGGEGLAG